MTSSQTNSVAWDISPSKGFGGKRERDAGTGKKGCCERHAVQTVVPDQDAGMTVGRTRVQDGRFCV